MEYYEYIRWLVLFVAVSCLRLCAQPAACREDTHCSDGYYCETDANICRECLSCEDLKREPPLTINTCIKSVAECGPCINQLVDWHGDVNAESVPPADPQLEQTPSSLWRPLSIGLLFFLALVVGIIAIITWFLLRYLDIFKTAGSNQSSTVSAHFTATAPEDPPPYNPYHLPPYSKVEPTACDEDEPFIMQHSPPSRPQDAREWAGHQATVVFNEPVYGPTPSAESPVSENTETLTLPINDEDTMPSPWMPGTTSNGDVNVAPDNSANEPEGAAAALSAQMSAAHDTTLVEHSAATKRYVRQDSQESNCGDSSHSSSPRSGSTSAGGPPHNYITNNIITNVVVNTSN